MDDEKDFILIEEYLDGVLEGDALSAFERRLREEPELSAELALYKEMNERLIENSEKQTLRKEWTSIIKESEAASDDVPSTNEPNKETAKIRTLSFYLSRLAVAILLGFIIYVIWPKSVSDEQLALNYWEQTVTFDFTSVDRSTALESTYLAKLKALYSAYENNDYQNVVELSKTISPRSEEVQLLEGAAAFYLAQYQNAIGNFNQILSDATSTSKDEAMWYLALTYLKSGDRSNALSTLNTIITQNSWKAKEAQELYDKISD